MKYLVAVGLTVLPFIAFAVPITSSPPSPAVEVLDVEFWGRLYTHEESEDHVLGPKIFGNPIHATFRVQNSFAPDRRDTTPGEAFYAYNTPGSTQFPAPSDFVTSDLQTYRGRWSQDIVALGDNIVTHSYDPRQDFFRVANLENTPDANEGSTLSISIWSPVDFIHGLGLRQEFDIEPEKTGGVGSGYVAGFVDGFRNFSMFVVDRVRATPRACRF